MDLFDVARSCFRRWYVVLPVLLVAGWFSHHVYTSTKPVYYSNAVLGVTPPSSRLDQTELGVPVPRNGLLDLGGASLVSNLAVLGLREPSVVAQVVAGGGEANYTTKMFPVPATMPELPLIMVETTQPDPVAASKTIELVLAQADSTLQKMQKQASVPDDQMVQPFVVSPPSAPAAGVPSRTKSTIVVFAAGAGIAILLGVVLDVLLLRRRPLAQKRRHGNVGTVAEANPAAPQHDVHNQLDTDQEDRLAPAPAPVMGGG